MPPPPSASGVYTRAYIYSPCVRACGRERASASASVYSLPLSTIARRPMLSAGAPSFNFELRFGNNIDIRS